MCGGVPVTYDRVVTAGDQFPGLNDAGTEGTALAGLDATGGLVDCKLHEVLNLLGA